MPPVLNTALYISHTKIQWIVKSAVLAGRQIAPHFEPVNVLTG